MTLSARVVIIAASTIFAVGGLLFTWYLVGVRNAVGAFTFCFLPTSWVFCVKRAVPIRLPERYYRLQAWERQGRVYERIGVRRFQRLLKIRLLGTLNVEIGHRFRQRDYAAAEREMRFAETSHVLAFLLALAVTVYSLTRGWWDAVGFLVGFNLVVNAYPVMLQRYNRGRLSRLLSRGRRREDSSSESS